MNDTITISDEVIAIIAGTAALETDGLAPQEPVDTRGRRTFSKGVKINRKDNQVSVFMGIKIKQNAKIAEVTAEAQRRVKTAIETMTGLFVVTVDIHVLGLE